MSIKVQRILILVSVSLLSTQTFAFEEPCKSDISTYIAIRVDKKTSKKDEDKNKIFSQLVRDNYADQQALIAINQLRIALAGNGLKEKDINKRREISTQLDRLKKQNDDQLRNIDLRTATVIEKHSIGTLLPSLSNRVKKCSKKVLVDLASRTEGLALYNKLQAKLLNDDLNKVLAITRNTAKKLAKPLRESISEEDMLKELDRLEASGTYEKSLPSTAKSPDNRMHRSDSAK